MRNFLMKRTRTVVLIGLSLALVSCQTARNDRGNEPELRDDDEHAGEASRVGDPSDWCRGHALPESMCTKCNPELLEGFLASGDWCAEHELPESVCPQCNPMLPPGSTVAPQDDTHGGDHDHADEHEHVDHAREASRVGDPSDWCGGHALPESMCTRCNPELLAGFQASGDWCAGHGFPESACPQCNPMQPPRARGNDQEADHEHQAEHEPNDHGDEHEPNDHGDEHRHRDHAAEHGPNDHAAEHEPNDHGDEHGHRDHAAEHGQDNQPAETHRVGDPSDWCGGNGLPESMCTKCNPELLAGFQASGDWCAEHELPESVCPVCNPMLPPRRAAAPSNDARTAHHGDEHGHENRVEHAAARSGDSRVGDPADWCTGHGLPESYCTLCNPELTEGFQTSGDWCAEHELPESVCPQCNPMAPPPGVAAPSPIAPGTLVRFASPSIEDAVGIETVSATQHAVGIGVEAAARIEFDQNAMAEVRSPVSGIVQNVAIDLGDVVSAGDTLFTLESAHVGDLQARRSAVRQRFETAESNFARQEELLAGSVTSERQVELARQELEAARAELRAIEQSLRISGASRGGRSGAFAVTAPIGGTIVRRPGIVGTFASEADSLATIVDTSRVWAILEVPEWDSSAVRIGQPADVEVDGVSGEVFSGSITWIASEVDSRTRTVQVRVELENTDHLLRSGQFARAVVHVSPLAGAVSVPLDAVQRFGEDSVVFVRTEPGVFEPRVVETGRSDGRLVQLAGAVAQGDLVVTTGAFLLRTELSRDSIGAGCCEAHVDGGE